MLERFQGKDGRVALLNALRGQFLVDGNTEIADKIASTVQVREYDPGLPLFSQGERGSDLYFVLHGRVSVSVNNQEIATVGAGMHVGEIALLEPFKGRSATVTAVDSVVAALITQQRFTEIARFHPELWRRMAIELARRLVKAQAGG
ncbi:MAG TPA: cyclic nucleotide-binding domain-containing protein [Burkholderiales bacterium]|jgi:CRP-like cAMP-binding protein|nr:cyclic nucleotide-binding domain-containing protein [Burkholderiales bacterium]